jgi:hypothetical protein
MIGESVCDFFVEGPIRNSRRRGGTGVHRLENDLESGLVPGGELLTSADRSVARHGQTRSI